MYDREAEKGKKINERTFSYNEKRSVYPLFMHNKGGDVHILALN